MAGRKVDALRVLDELLILAQKGNAVYAGVGFIYYRLGEKDKAFEWLERAYQAREAELIYLGVDPHLDDLRSDPRCITLLQKMGLRQ
jgi:tetratricopeptide (TPR) repeat protein